MRMAEQEGQAFNYCTTTICLLFNSTEAIAENGLWVGGVYFLFGSVGLKDGREL